MPKRKNEDSGSSSGAAVAASVDETEALNTAGNPTDDEVQNWIQFAKNERHNEACKQSRARNKRKKVEMEKELYETREENKKMKEQKEEDESKLRDLETAFQDYKKFVEGLAADMDWMSSMIDLLIGNFVELIPSQHHVQVGEGSNYSNLSPYAAGPSVADHPLHAPDNNFSTHNPATGLSAFASGTSSVANQNLISGFGFADNGLNDIAFIDYGHDYGFLPTAAAGSYANHDCTVAPYNSADTGFPTE